jgi:hypothetical protein
MEYLRFMSRSSISLIEVFRIIGGNIFSDKKIWDLLRPQKGFRTAENRSSGVTIGFRILNVWDSSVFSHMHLEMLLLEDKLFPNAYQ